MLRFDAVQIARVCGRKLKKMWPTVGNRIGALRQSEAARLRVSLNLRIMDAIAACLKLN
jgi:hypothetical protein